MPLFMSLSISKTSVCKFKFWFITFKKSKTNKFIKAWKFYCEIHCLFQIYKNFVDNVTVYMGPGNGHRFFTVNKFHGRSRLGYWQNETCDSVQGATEGVTYHQGISKNDTLRYLRKTICRVTPLIFSSKLIYIFILLRILIGFKHFKLTLNIQSS